MIKGYKLLGVRPLNPNQQIKVVIVKRLTLWQRVKKWLAR